MTTSGIGLSSLFKNRNEQDAIAEYCPAGGEILSHTSPTTNYGQPFTGNAGGTPYQGQQITKTYFMEVHCNPTEASRELTGIPD